MPLLRHVARFFSTRAPQILVAVVAIAGLVAAVDVQAFRFGNDSSFSVAMSFPTASGEIGSLRIVRAYIPQPASPSVAAAYFTVENSGSADTLSSVSSDVTSNVGLHETVERGSVATMVSVQELAIPAHGSVVLSPGGRHLMLMSPARALRAGDVVQIELTFAGAGTVTLGVPVVTLSAVAGASDKN